MKLNKTSRIMIRVLVIYTTLTIMEHWVHKNIMHSKTKGTGIFAKLIDKESESHGLHHQEVQSDMSLEIGDHEPHKGLFFLKHVTLVFAVILFIILKLKFKLMKLDVKNSHLIYICLGCTLTYSLLWNSIHPLMHAENELILPMTQGVTNKYHTTLTKFIPSFYYNYLFIHHAQHHAVKSNGDKYNYNIILPGADYIFGTKYRGNCFDNTEFCKDSDLKACDKPKGCFSVQDGVLHMTEVSE